MVLVVGFYCTLWDFLLRWSILLWNEILSNTCRFRVKFVTSHILTTHKTSTKYRKPNARMLAQIGVFVCDAVSDSVFHISPTFTYEYDIRKCTYFGQRQAEGNLCAMYDCRWAYLWQHTKSSHNTAHIHNTFCLWQTLDVHMFALLLHVIHVFVRNYL